MFKYLCNKASLSKNSNGNAAAATLSIARLSSGQRQRVSNLGLSLNNASADRMAGELRLTN